MFKKDLLVVFLLSLFIPCAQSQVATITETPLIVLGESNCRALAVTPNDDAVIMAMGKNIMIWGVEEDNIINQLQGHTELIQSMAVSSSGRYLVTGSTDKTVRLWDLKAGQLVKTFKGHEGSVTAVGFSGDETKIVSASMDKTIKVWELHSNRPKLNLEGHTDWITSVAFSPNGQYLLSCSADKTARLWSLTQKTEIAIYEGHLNGVNGGLFSKDGLTVYTIANDSQVREFNAMNGVIKRRYSLAGRNLTGLSLSADGKKLAIANSYKILVLETKKWKPIVEYTGHQAIVNQVAFMNKSDFVISSAIDKTIKQWDAKRGDTFRVFLEKKISYEKGVFADKRKMAITGTEDGKIQFYSLQSGNAIKLLKAHEATITALAVSQDETYLLSGSLDKEIKLWDIENGTLINTFPGHKGKITALAFADDKSILSASEDKTVRKWDIASGQLIRKLKAHNSFVTGLGIAPNGKEFATCSEDRLVKVWDVHSFELKNTIKGHQSFITSMKYAPDGDHILTTTWDNEVALWNIASSEKQSKFTGHTDKVTAIDFSPDGNYILSGSADKSVRLWQVSNQQIIEIFNGHIAPITCAAFSKDGQYILTTSKDNTAKVWLAGLDVQGGEVAQEAVTPISPTITAGCSEAEVIENNNFVIAWHSPSERRYRNEVYVLNDNFLEIELEIESKTPIERGGLALLVNGLKGAKFSETSLQDYSKDGASIYYYSFKERVKFQQSGTHCLQLQYTKKGKVISSSQIIRVNYEPEKINLYLLTIGTNPVDLKFPTQDAVDFAAVFENQPLFKKVYTRKLIAEEATATRIKLELSKLRKNRFITDRDMVMVFISSHGFIRPDGNFCLQASDYDLIDPEETSIAFNEITDRLNDLNCKKILMMDACHSGVAAPHLLVGRKDNASTAARSALKKLLDKKDGWLMVTSSGDEPSWEHEDWQNGSFTEAIVLGLQNGEADANQNGLISIKEFYNYLVPKVTELNESVNFPAQSPQITNTLGGDLEFFQIQR